MAGYRDTLDDEEGRIEMSTIMPSNPPKVRTGRYGRSGERGREKSSKGKPLRQSRDALARSLAELEESITEMPPGEVPKPVKQMGDYLDNARWMRLPWRILIGLYQIQKGISRQELAKDLGVSKMRIWRWKTGVHEPRVERSEERRVGKEGRSRW